MTPIKALALVILVLLSSLFTHSTQAAEVRDFGYGSFGLGAVLGEPTGFRGRYGFSPTQGVDVGLAFSLASFAIINGDYNYYFRNIAGTEGEMRTQFFLRAGVGAVIFFSNAGTVNNIDSRYYFDTSHSFGLGIRIPLGAEWRFRHLPLGIFAEVAPGLGLVPGTFGFVQGGIGALYFFN
jgi:hypothetical protein